MRAELDASLCIPQDYPVSIRIDEIKAGLISTGLKAGVSLQPVELQLPTAEVTLPGVTVTLPKPVVTVKAEMTFDSVFAYIDKWRALVNSLDLLKPGDIAVGLAAPALLGVGV